MKGVVIVMLTTVLVMVGLTVRPSEAITCAEVDHLLGPCLTYLRYGGSPPQECCNGLKKLEDECESKSDKQIACNCCKSAARTFQIREELAEGLPNECGITTSVPISPTVDCSRISFYESYNLRWLKLPDLV